LSSLFGFLDSFRNADFKLVTETLIAKYPNDLDSNLESELVQLASFLSEAPVEKSLLESLST